MVDADALGLGPDECLRHVLGMDPVAVGMTVTSYTLDLIEGVAERFAFHGVPVIVGGPHATLAPSETLLRCPSVDLLVRGEGEAVFPEVVEGLRAGADISSIPGVCSRTNDGLRLSETTHRIEDFATLPFPRFTGLPLTRYWCPDAQRRPMVTFMTGRGCPHTCSFCSSPTLLGRRVRGPAVGRVLDELQRLQGDHGVAEVSFVDDVFSAPRSRSISICEGIVERDLDLSWFCNARADHINEPLAAAMAAAGCHQVYLGFESGSQAVLDRAAKGTSVERLELGAEILRRCGISRSIGFVVGLPGETDETIAETIALAQRVRPERVQFTALTPLVGTSLYASGRDGTFHSAADPRVKAWVDACYAAIGAGWGRPSL